MPTVDLIYSVFYGADDGARVQPSAAARKQT